MICARELRLSIDHKKFLALVEELNRILSAQDKSFDKSAPKQNNE